MRFPFPPPRFRRGAVALVAVAALAAAGCGEVRPAAATIDGRAVPRESFLRELRALRDNKELAKLAGGADSLKGDGRSGTFDARLAARWLDRLVVQAVIDREFERRHLTVRPEDRAGAQTALTNQFGTPKVVAAFPAWFRERLLGRAERQAILEAKLSGPPINDTTVKQFYDEHTNLFATTCLSHILVKTKAEASALAEQIAGGADFGTLAKQKSTDVASGAQDGSLGCTDLTKFVKEFADAAAKLPVNQLSARVHSQFGWHLILVTRRDPAPSFDSVKSSVSDVMTQRTRGQFAAVIGEELRKASVHIDPRFGTYRFDPQNGPTIDPPTAPNPPESPTTSPANRPGSQPGGATLTPSGDGSGGPPAGSEAPAGSQPGQP